MKAPHSFSRIAGRMAAAATVCALALAIPAHAASVTADRNPNVDFTRLHTFSFGRIDASPLFAQDLRQHVAWDLTTQLGWQWVKSGGDVVITAVSGQPDDQQYANFYNSMNSWSWHPAWDHGSFDGKSMSVSQIPPGTMVIDMYGARSHQLLFRGTASNEETTDMNKYTERLDHKIDKIINKLPQKA
jgi:hypothetical protein